MDIDELVATLRAIEPDPAMLAKVRAGLPGGTGGFGPDSFGGSFGGSLASKLFIAFVGMAVVPPAPDVARPEPIVVVAAKTPETEIPPAAEPVEEVAPEPEITESPREAASAPRRARPIVIEPIADAKPAEVLAPPILAQALPDAIEVPPEDPSAPPSEAYAAALRHYARNEHRPAASLAFEVASGASSDSADRAAHAEFVLAKALFHLGLYHSSALAFETITERGSEHPYFAQCLPWIAKLATFLPEDTAVIASLSRYERTALAELDRAESRDEYENLVYMLGRARYDEGEIDEAIALFRSIPRTSRQWVKAQLQLGVAHVRARRARPAVIAFRGAAEAIDDDDVSVEDEDRLRDLAWLNLARVYYTAANQGEEEGRPTMDGALVGAAVDA
jgi:tetratricopeptide (TPR) repeat protein